MLSQCTDKCALFLIFSAWKFLDSAALLKQMPGVLCWCHMYCSTIACLTSNNNYQVYSVCSAVALCKIIWLHFCTQTNANTAKVCILSTQMVFVAAARETLLFHFVSVIWQLLNGFYNDTAKWSVRNSRLQWLHPCQFTLSNFDWFHSQINLCLFNALADLI